MAVRPPSSSRTTSGKNTLMKNASIDVHPELFAAAPAKPRSRQAIVTEEVRRLLASGLPLPSERRICRELAVEHRGKFVPEQSARIGLLNVQPAGLPPGRA